MGSRRKKYLKTSKIPTTIVIDASAVLSFIIFDEKTPDNVELAFDSYSKRQSSFIAPDLLRIEVTNALRSAVKRKRLTKKLSKEILEGFLSLDITYKNINEVEILDLAIKNNISAYDATYLWLSKKESATLLTLDKKLANLV